MWVVVYLEYYIICMYSTSVCVCAFRKDNECTFRKYPVNSRNLLLRQSFSSRPSQVANMYFDCFVFTNHTHTGSAVVLFYRFNLSNRSRRIGTVWFGRLDRRFDIYIVHWFSCKSCYLNRLCFYIFVRQTNCMQFTHRRALHHQRLSLYGKGVILTESS